MKITRISLLILSLVLSAVVSQGHGQGATQTTRDPALYVSRHAGHFDAFDPARGITLSGFETLARLEAYAKENGFQLVETKPPVKEAFYCGAMTKAGTPCKHRVKVKGAHCWQHQGAAKK